MKGSPRRFSLRLTRCETDRGFLRQPSFLCISFFFLVRTWTFSLFSCPFFIAGRQARLQCTASFATDLATTWAIRECVFPRIWLSKGVNFLEPKAGRESRRCAVRLLPFPRHPSFEEKRAPAVVIYRLSFFGVPSFFSKGSGVFQSPLLRALFPGPDGVLLFVWLPKSLMAPHPS